ncbi:ABC transporter permease/M1 family aminopeptidase [Flavobacterium poyangense]|uniref:ABC transporter permease/M1 family aminopeptidase n=1 Tax=Flavobacterium poyangense TaxID=2204302 RepID=UPI0014227185|nr:hypothetical protein [Flavobacterium sp. JXAS1]
MIKAIYNFEIRQQLKRPVNWVICFLMLLQGIYYMHHSGEFYANDETYANASAIFFTVFAGIGYVGFIVTAIIAGTVITKDLQSRFSSIIFTTWASESGYFWGRYWSGFTIMLGLNFFYLLGAFCYSFLPVKNLGPADFPALLSAISYILIPNTFILYTLCFSASALTRDIKSSYMASMFVMLIMIFSVSMHELNRAAALYDPTSFGVLLDELEHMSAAEKNNFMPPLFGNLMWNRLGWTAIALTILLISRKRFSFKKFSMSVSGKKQKQINDEIFSKDKKNDGHKIQLKSLPAFSVFQDWKNVFSLSLTEFRSVVAPSGFKIFLSLLLVIYIFYIAVWQQQYYSAAPTLPVTVEITNVTIALSFYFQLFIIINTVELLFRSQSSGFWKIADALPVPSWVTTLSKINAMIMVSILLSLCLIVFGICVQAGKGYFNFELLVYIKEVILRWFPKYLGYILICTAIAGITGNKYITHGLTILVLVLTIILHEIGVLEQFRLAFTLAPGTLKYTDMNGSSFFGTANLWYSFYWISLSLALTFLGLLVWPRGLTAPLNKRFHFKGRTAKLLAAFCFICITSFVFAANHIYQTVNVQNQFSSREEERRSDADYEKKYKKYENLPQPKIQHINLVLNLSPEQRLLQYHAAIKVTNPYDSPIISLHIEWVDFLKIENISCEDKSLKKISNDDLFGHAIYQLEKPLLPGEIMWLNVKAEKHYSGFTNSEPQADIAFNGSFISEDFLPFIGGYDNRRELADNKYRKDYKLKPIVSSLPKTPADKEKNFSFASTQSNGFTFDCTISTPDTQQAVMPGLLVKEWKENGKKYYQFRSEKAIPFQWNILLAAYASKKQQVQVNGKNIDIEVYYHPGHPYNVTAWIESAKEALVFLNKQLGEYPYSKLIIAERPRYDEDLHISGNLITLPENHGWIADIRRNEDRDYLRYITTSLIGQQYFNNGNFSRVQGFPLLTNSIPSYLALVQMDQLYGKTSVSQFLKKNHDKYLAGRAVSGIKEQPILYCDINQEYIYNYKGIEVLYQTSEEIVDNKILLAQIKSFYNLAAVSKIKLTAEDWYHDLQRITPKNKRELLDAKFIKLL